MLTSPCVVVLGDHCPSHPTRPSTFLLPPRSKIESAPCSNRRRNQMTKHRGSNSFTEVRPRAGSKAPRDDERNHERELLEAHES